MINFILMMTLAGLAGAAALAVMVCAFDMILNVLEEHKDLWRNK